MGKKYKWPPETLEDLFCCEPAEDDGEFGHNPVTTALELEREHPLAGIENGLLSVRIPRF